MNARQAAKKYKKLSGIYKEKAQKYDMMILANCFEESQKLRIQTAKIEVNRIIDDRVIIFKTPIEVEIKEVAKEIGECLIAKDFVNVTTDPPGTDTLQKRVYSVEVVRRSKND